jgi:hypothetical protein
MDSRDCLRFRCAIADVSVVSLRWHIGSLYQVAGLCVGSVVRVVLLRVVLHSSAKTRIRTSRWPDTARRISETGISSHESPLIGETSRLHSEPLNERNRLVSSTDAFTLECASVVAVSTTPLCWTVARST